jgi:hypothetical protein
MVAVNQDASNLQLGLFAKSALSSAHSRRIFDNALLSIDLYGVFGKRHFQWGR